MAGTLLLLNGVAATSAVPTLATDGFPLKKTSARGSSDEGFYDLTGTVGLFLWAAVTAATVGSITVRLWLYLPSYRIVGVRTAVGVWFPLGAGADGTKGTINAGGAMGETDTNLIAHAEVIDYLQFGERVYAQVVAIANVTSASLLLRQGQSA